MSDVQYPYLPEGKSFKFACSDDPHMQEAARAREECAGDRLFPVGAVFVRDGKAVARAGNGYNRGNGFVHVCPRIVMECPSGTGYEFCQFHDAHGHAEPMLMATVKEQGIDPRGYDVYMYGHWWCCEPCWKVMIDAGVRDVYLLENAHEEFQRDRVYAQTLKSSVRFVYFSNPEWSDVCQEIGCQVVERAEDADVLVLDEIGSVAQQTKPIILISSDESSNSSVVYQIRTKATVEIVIRQLRNVLKQL